MDKILKPEARVSIKDGFERPGHDIPGTVSASFSMGDRIKYAVTLDKGYQFYSEDRNHYVTVLIVDAANLTQA